MLSSEMATNKGAEFKGESTDGEVLMPLIHVQQRHDWDCGVACVLMILHSEDKKHLLDNLTQICLEEGFNTSTWTIDLCYLLNRYTVPYLYCTTTLGVHPDFTNYSFYYKILLKDKERVTKRFAEAAAKGMPVQQASLTGEELRFHLAERGPVILLTNANLLRCQTCQNDSFWLNSLRSYLPPWKLYTENSSPSYHGHYIVLCGFNELKQVYYYRNPGLKDELCSMSFSSIDQARKSSGTDQDVILIFFKKKA